MGPWSRSYATGGPWVFSLSTLFIVETALARLPLYDRTPLAPFELSFWQAADVRIEFALFTDETLSTLVTDFTNLTNVQLEVHKGKTGGGGLIIAGEQILAGNLNPSLTLTQWNAGTHQHGAFQLTAAQMNQVVDYGVLECWATIFSSTADGGKIIHGAGPFRIHRSRASGAGAPPTPPTLYYTKSEVDAIIANIQTTESPYIICDTESEVNAALQQGRWIVLRGEGNGGVINFSTIKYIDVPGTRILGYGYKPSGGANQYAQVRYNFPTTKALTTQFPDMLFYVRASDVELAGFGMLGLSTLSTTVASCIGVIISASHAINNLQIRDINARNLYNFVSKQGAQGVPATQNLVIERCRVTNLTHFGLNLRESFYDTIIRDNIFECREAGGPNPPEFQWMQGMQIDSDIKNCLIENNKVLRPARMGIELIAEGYAAPVFTTMLQNRILGNTVLDAGSMGISITYSTDTIIAENIIDGAVSIGLESSNGHTYLESSNRHQCKLINNIIRNVTSPANFVSGISLDSSFGDEVYGNTIEHVSSGYTNANLSQQASYCRGIVLQRARRAKIRHNTFNYVDGVGIFAQPGNGQYQHVDRIVIENNEFFLDAAQTKAYFAMWLQGSRAVVKNNVSWVPSAWTGPTPNRGGFLGEFQGTTPIEIGNEASMPAYSNYFRDTNLLLSY